jgi:hypothetical protein
MASVTIPESAYPALKSLIRLSPADFDALCEALSKASPALDPDNFWSHVTPHVSQIETFVVKSILTEIGQMAIGFSVSDTELTDFASAIAEASSAEIVAGEREILKERLIKIFTGRKGLNITTKAMGVMLDQDRIFYSARVLTDVRSVFNEKGDTVEAAVIVHNLRIHYGQDSEHKDFYVALDTSDIQALRKELDRADTKAKALEAILKRSGVSYLDAEE